jgi:hypothetical protein
MTTTFSSRIRTPTTMGKK